MNLIDKIVEAVSPSAALRREEARYKLRTVREVQNSGYDESGAARNKNSMRGWQASSKTPQEDIDRNIPVLRQRSRSLYMSAPLAVSAIKTNRTNIVGAGLRLKSTIDADFLGMTADEAAEWKRSAEREFELWAQSKFCDSTRVNNFYEIQQTACISWLMNGDACILLEYDRPTRMLPYGLRLHLVESDRFSTPHSGGTMSTCMQRIRTRITGSSMALRWMQITGSSLTISVPHIQTAICMPGKSGREWMRLGRRQGHPMSS